MVEENLRLVSFVIQKYVQFNPNTVLYQWEDLFQTGCLGLVKAAKSFNPNAGFTFSTFATRCILNQIRMLFRKPSVSMISADSPIENGSGDKCSLADFLQDDSQDVSSLYDLHALRDFLMDKSQQSQKESIVIQTLLKLITQQQAAKELQCSQPQVSRCVTRLRSEIQSLF